MTRMIFCTNLKKEAEGLLKAPYPGELGQKIYNEISKEAWKKWLNQQTMLINEHRLNLLDPKTKTMLETSMERFLFHGEEQKPADFVPPK